jgi:hypothetical protein
MNSSDGYRYTSLTSALDDVSSPLRRYLEDTFPNRKPVQAGFRATSGALLVPGDEAVNAGTVGAAFDFMVRLVLDHSHIPEVAAAGASVAGATPDVFLAVVNAGQQTAAGCRSVAAPEALTRAAWVLALYTEVYRLGVLPPGSPLYAVADANPEDVLAVASDAAVCQLQGLHALAIRNLHPVLPDTPARVVPGPTFAASRYCAADADVIIDGMLLESKTRLGSKNARTGARSDSLSVLDLYQMLGYVLFDHDDTYSLDRVAFYSARYGSLTMWPVQDLLEILHGGPVNLANERERVWELLGGPSRQTRARVNADPPGVQGAS